MSNDVDRYGERLYEELRRLSGYDLIVNIMDYKAIQQLKASDRQGTLKLFRGSNYEVIQLLKNDEPEVVAQNLVAMAEEAKKASEDTAVALQLMVNCISL